MENSILKFSTVNNSCIDKVRQKVIAIGTIIKLDKQTIQISKKITI